MRFNTVVIGINVKLTNFGYFRDQISK